MAKFNSKSIAVGIGIGLILSASLNIKEASKPIALKVLEDQALKYYGKVLIDSELKDSIPETTPTPTESLLISPTAEATPTITPTEVPSISPTVTPTLTATPTPSESTTNENESVSFSVKDNTTSEAVAIYLSKGGIVEKDVFLKELNRRGLSTKIRNGNYTFYNSATLDEIIKVLTGR